MTSSGRWDIVFLITGQPLPAQLDMAKYATDAGRRALMIILERGKKELVIDRALVNYEVITIDVPYQAVDWNRITSTPRIYRQLKRIVTEGLAPGGVLVASSFDLLVFGWLMSIGRDYKLRLQVRDLHRLQVSDTFLSRVLRTLERFLLRRVDRVMVSSAEFDTGYYRRIYSGQVALVENIPARSTWTGFTRARRSDSVFRIGFIGILRYPESLRQLIRAVQQLAASGAAINVKFAGGGVSSNIAPELRESPQFTFLGPYEYTKDITRLYSDIDLIYAVYDSTDRNCQVAMPNKFYESMLSGIPIIVAKHTFVEREVMREGIGTSVLSGDSETLVRLLEDAIAKRGWYASALDRLSRSDMNPYYAAYEQGLKSSVLP